MPRPDTLWTLAFTAAVLLAACNDTGKNDAPNAYFGPGSAPATPVGGAPAVGGFTGPNGQPDDHGNDINNATYMAGAQVGVPPMTGSGSLDYAGDVDVFQIYINAGTYDFSTVTTEDTILVLQDAGGNTIAQNDDEDPAQGKFNSLIANHQIPITGIHYLLVAEGAQSQPLPITYQVQVQ